MTNDLNELMITFDRAKEAARPMINTSTGWIAGIVDATRNQERFLGIPYAEAPIGEHRFKAPVLRHPWTGVFDASRFGAAAPQVFDPCEGSYEEFTGLTSEAPGSAWVGSEDCLTLNVWRRVNGAEGKPVLVWIHGGANWLESSRLDIYHGDQFVGREDVIFVSMNYRLGIFGFLDITEIAGSDYKGGHSNGLRDQRLALRWIKDNVAAFGGDPENITVMGESAGSIDISWHLSGGYLDGIAKRVILMSGIASLPGLSGTFEEEFTEAHARRRCSEFLERMGINSAKDLLNSSTDQLMTKVVDVAWSSETLFDMDSLFWPRAEEACSNKHPYAAIRESKRNGIDVMLGCTGYEMGLWLNWDKELDRRGLQWAAEKLRHLTDDQRRVCISSYRKWFPKEDDGRIGMRLLGDSIFLMPTLWFAEELTRRGENVWLYQFDKISDERRGALHAADQAYLFDKRATFAGRQLVPEPMGETEISQQSALTSAMQDAVLAFARTGSPNQSKNSSLPFWPNYDLETRRQMSFDTVCSIVSDPAEKRREWWTSAVYR